MNAEFNWWLLIVGLVIGAALTWLVMAESTRRDADITDSEQRGEAGWIASILSASGRPTDPPRVEEILRLHREYLGAPPPDEESPSDGVAAVGADASIETAPDAAAALEGEPPQPLRPGQIPRRSEPPVAVETPERDWRD